MTTDPEAVFRRFPRALRRWTWRSIMYRLRLPHRRRRWQRADERRTAAYARAERIAKPEIRADGSQSACAMGDFSGLTGLSRAAIYEVEALRQIHPELVVHDLSDAIHRGANVEPEPGEPIDFLYLLSAPDTYATVLQKLPPARLRNAWRTGLWVWETPNFPSRWTFALGLVDEIWTPSAFSQRAIGKAAGTIPVHVRPHAVRVPDALDREAARTALLDRFALSARTFIGAAIMDISSCPARKNPWAHVAAWQGAFGKSPEHVLLLKIRTSRRTRLVLDELRELIGSAGNIRLLTEDMPESRIHELQAGANVYLSLHRAEGYGLNIHESLLLGTPVLATGFSANTEYGNAFGNYTELKYRLTRYRDWTGHYANGDFSWAEVDLSDTQAHLRRLSDGLNGGIVRA